MANQLLIFATICSTVVMTIIIAFHNMVLHGAFGEVSEDVMSAANDVKFCMVVSIISMWAVRIAPSYMLAGNLGFGVKGVWIAMILDWCARSVFFTVHYKREKWIPK